MRVIIPDFKCPYCNSELTKVTDEGSVWGVSVCKNKKCDYWIDVHALVYDKSQKILNS